MGAMAEGIPRVCEGGLIISPASLGYSLSVLLSVFNKNSILKEKKEFQKVNRNFGQR